MDIPKEEMKLKFCCNCREKHTNFGEQRSSGSSVEHSAFILLTDSFQERPLEKLKDPSLFSHFSPTLDNQWSLMNSIINMQHHGIASTVKRQQMLFNTQHIGFETDSIICENCAEDAAELIQRDCKEVEKQIFDYRAALQHAESQIPLQNDEFQPQLDHFGKSCEHYCHVLKDAENQLKSIKTCNGELIEKLQMTSASVKEQHHKLVNIEAEKRQIREKASSILDDVRSVCSRAGYLSSYSAFEKMFQIQVHDPIPSINGFRISRTLNENNDLEWDEINEGFGQMCLMLQCVSNQIGFCSTSFKIIPLNSCSRVLKVKKSYTENFNLYSNCWKKEFLTAVSILEDVFIEQVEFLSLSFKKSNAASKGKETLGRRFDRLSSKRAAPEYNDSGEWDNWFLMFFVRVKQMAASIKHIDPGP